MSNEGVKRLAYNIALAIRTARGSRVSAMSLANLRQVTPTAGLRGVITPAQFGVEFPRIARSVAAAMRFRILPDQE